MQVKQMNLGNRLAGKTRYKRIYFLDLYALWSYWADTKYIERG